LNKNESSTRIISYYYQVPVIQLLLYRPERIYNMYNVVGSCKYTFIILCILYIRHVSYDVHGHYSYNRTTVSPSVQRDLGFSGRFSAADGVFLWLCSSWSIYIHMERRRKEPRESTIVHLWTSGKCLPFTNIICLYYPFRIRALYK